MKNANRKKQKKSSPIIAHYADFLYWVVFFSMILINIIFFNLRIKGRKNLKQINKIGCFIISNHSLYLDPTIIIHAVAPRRIYFTALEETFQMPVIGTYIRLLGAFSVSKKISSIKTLIKNVKSILDKKRFIHFFPEGDLKHLNRNINDFKTGVFSLAFRFNKPVIPITLVIKHKRIFGFKIHRFFFRVEAIIGKPIYPSNFKSASKNTMEQIREMSDYAHDVMMTSIKSSTLYTNTDTYLFN